MLYNYNKFKIDLLSADKTDEYYKYISNVICVIDDVLEKSSKEKGEMIKLIYFDKTHTVIGAGMCVGFGRTLAFESRLDVLVDIAKGIGCIK